MIILFPTPVGMNRDLRRQLLQKLSVPHTRGDEPIVDFGFYLCDFCSPHPWG